jgi:2-oxoglutarate ferredoxin oxidoreductase subunit alpha
MMERLKKKYKTARKYVPKPIIRKMRGAKTGIIAYGSTDPAVKEARHLLKLANINSDFLRLRSLPFTNDTKDFIEHHNKIYIIEMNRDGQLHQLLKIEYPEQAIKLFSIASSDGLPATAKWITDAIIKEGG